MATARADLSAFFKKLKSSVDQTVTQQQMIKLGNDAVNIIVKRTRLGYGVKDSGGERFALSSIPWSPMYQALRKVAKLDETTRPKKSNLTFTGQMLRSVKVIRAQGGKVIIGPTGARKEGGTNDEVARGNAKRGRVFLNLSLNEQNQLVRIYRQQFTGLLKKLALIR